MKLSVEVKGLDDVLNVLRQSSNEEAMAILSMTVLDIAKEVEKDAKSFAPDDPATSKGDLKSSIGSAYTDQQERYKVEAAVGVLRSAFYWRFLEYGQGPDHVEHAFFLKALQDLKGKLEGTFLNSFVKKYTTFLVAKGETK